jgi:DNA-binding transcriptional MerR regulator
MMTSPIFLPYELSIIHSNTNSKTMHPQKQTYTTSDLIRGFGVSFQELKSLDEQQIVVPNRENPISTMGGPVWRYSYHQALVVAIINNLRKRGVSLEALREVADDILHRLSQVEAQYLILCGDFVEIAQTDADAILFIERLCRAEQQPCSLVDVRELAHMLTEQRRAA